MSEEINDLYRNTHIGIALEDTLTQLYDSGEIDSELKNDFMKQFQETLINILTNDCNKICSINGHLHTYQNMDNNWRFWIKDATIKNDNLNFSVDMLKIVAVSEDHKMAEADVGKPFKKRKVKEEYD
jgi:Transcription initiation factor IIA, gamma subunit/Transcription initiation factor IIA, gamma subunit, helical domain